MPRPVVAEVVLIAAIAWLMSHAHWSNGDFLVVFGALFTSEGTSGL